MKMLAISVLLVALTLGWSVRAWAQDAGVEPPPPVEEEKPDREPPTAGALPFEDPTIAPQRDEDLEVEEPEEPTSEPQADAEAPDRPTAAGPVEDPTQHGPRDTGPGEKPETAEGPAPEKDEGPNVKVVYDRGFLLSVDDWFHLALTGLVQARYTINYRTKPPTDPATMELDKKVTQGFDVPRARFTLGIGLTEFVALVMRIGVVAGGTIEFQRAFIDLKWKYFRMRAGLFMNELIAESLINPDDLLFLDYSIVDNVYTPGSSKGVMFTYLRYRFSINLGYSDGLRTGFSEIRSSVNADYAITLRTQYAWGDAGLAGFNRLIARRGTPFGIRLGGALHYQDGGRTQGSLPAKIASGTVDVSVRGNGWSALFSAVVGQDATDATETNEAGEVLSGGVTVMGGYFVLKDLQVFGQYSVVPKQRVQGTLPPALPGEIRSTPSNFHAFGVGLSYFVIPNHDNVKVSSDFQYFLGRESSNLVPSSPLNSIQPNDDGSQFAWRIQISARF
jgi:hypothetical protein